MDEKMKRLLKMSGIYCGGMLALLVVIYLLYPWINKEAHQQIEESYGADDTSLLADRAYIGQEIEDLIGQVEELRANERHLKATIDSLTAVNHDLQEQLDPADTTLSGHVASAGQQLATDVGHGRIDRVGLYGSAEKDEGEEFLEKVKSLLNLDEQELAPIINQMSNQQLIRLYNGGGSLHKEKLLRSLEPERAAAIMTEIML